MKVKKVKQLPPISVQTYKLQAIFFSNLKYHALNQFKFSA